MKFFAAIKKYMALNTAQKQFIKLKKRKFLMPHKEIIAFLEPMATFDFECDEAINQLFKINLTAFLLLCSSTFITGVSIEAAAVIGLISFLTLAAGIFCRIILGRINIHNSLRDFVLPLVSTFGEDADPQKQMQLSLDLSGKLLTTKLTSRKKDDPGWFSYPKVTTSIYNDYWFILQVSLVDGSQIHLSIHDRITSRAKTYKAISGKIKSKTKDKCKQFIKATVSVRNKSYGEADARQLQISCDRFKTKDGQNRKAFTLTRINSFYESDKYPQPSECLELIGKVFMNVNPAKSKGA